MGEHVRRSVAAGPGHGDAADTRELPSQAPDELEGGRPQICHRDDQNVGPIGLAQPQGRIAVFRLLGIVAGLRQHVTQGTARAEFTVDNDDAGACTLAHHQGAATPRTAYLAHGDAESNRPEADREGAAALGAGRPSPAADQAVSDPGGLRGRVGAWGARAVGPTRPRVGGVNGVLVRNGYVVAEWGDLNRVDMTFSATKSYLSTTVGIAVDGGLIRDVHDPVGDYVHDGSFDSDHNSRITWHHLLNQTSDWSGVLWDKPDWADRPLGDKWDHHRREMREPGTYFKYNDVRVNLLALAALHVWRRPLPAGVEGARDGSHRRVDHLALAWVS